jgi:hypothetical protein
MRVKRTAHVFGCALALVLAGAASPASAQTSAQTIATPNVEIGAGLQFLHVPGETYPFGWNLDLSGPIGEHEAVRWVGDGGMARDNPLPIERLSFYHIGGGVRLMPAQRRYAAPYVQFVGGAAYAKNNGTTVGLWGPMFQPGVGVSVPISRYMNITGQADYRLAVFSGQVDNEWRVSAGARFMLW